MVESIQLNITVDAGTWENQFDFLELWRSELGEGGPYHALMGNTWAPAKMPFDAGDPPYPPEAGPSVALVDRELEVVVNDEHTFIITFTGTNPLTYNQAAVQITAGSLSKVVAYVLGGKLILQSTEAGASTFFRVGGDAAPLLGLPAQAPLNTATGIDARLALNYGVTSYAYTDKRSDKSYFYKARFYNSSDHSVSEFGAPFNNEAIAGISGANLVRGFVDFVDMGGVARANQEVLVYTKTDGRVIEGAVLVPSAPTRLLSDKNGHVELMLVRGSKVTIALAGTDVVRDIDVPTDVNVTAFNLLDPTRGRNDLFKVQVKEMDFAARRNF